MAASVRTLHIVAVNVCVKGLRESAEESQERVKVKFLSRVKEVIHRKSEIQTLCR